MKNQNTRRGFTQYNGVGQAGPALQPCGAGSDNAPVKGHLAAFTLIELLVVVLIVGILAAVAVPQYQKAVEKSRASEALVIGNKLKQAQQLRHLQTGEWDGDGKDRLDIDISGGEWDSNNLYGGIWYTKDFMYSVENGDFVNVSRCQNPKDLDDGNYLYVLTIYADEEGYGPNLCVNLNQTSIGKYICNWLSTTYRFEYVPSKDE